MKLMVAVVNDGRVKYGLVDTDDEDAELVQLAETVAPPAFGFNEVATLGVNLINVLGLNGAKPKAKQATGAPLPPEGPAAKPPAKPKPKPKAKPGKRAYTPSEVERYITLDEILDVVKHTPDGITTKEIAQTIGKSETPPGWVMRAVQNRTAMAENKAKLGQAPLPFRVDYRPKVRQDGTESPDQTVKFILPLTQ